MNVLYCKVHYSTKKYSTVQYVTSLVDTYLLIKPLMLGPLDKSLVVGDIAIIASSSRGPGRPKEFTFS